MYLTTINGLQTKQEQKQLSSVFAQPQSQVVRAAFGRLGDSETIKVNAGSTWYDTLGDHAEDISTAPLLLDFLRFLSRDRSL
jgi:hypothetical protein